MYNNKHQPPALLCFCFFFASIRRTGGLLVCSSSSSSSSLNNSSSRATEMPPPCEERTITPHLGHPPPSLRPASRLTPLREEKDYRRAVTALANHSPMWGGGREEVAPAALDYRRECTDRILLFLLVPGLSVGTCLRRGCRRVELYGEGKAGSSGRSRTVRASRRCSGVRVSSTGEEEGGDRCVLVVVWCLVCCFLLVVFESFVVVVFGGALLLWCWSVVCVCVELY